MKPTLANATRLLKSVFGHHTYRCNQQEIIQSVLQRKDTLAILPTGGGKSLCFQIPALLFEHITIVISPLISLMKDQYDALVQKGLHDKVAFINSTISKQEQEKILHNIAQGGVKLLYLAPETLKMNYVLEVLQNVHIELCVIDEAHCISTWGSNFRPDYLRIVELLETLNPNSNIPLLALTATATQNVKDDITTILNRNFNIVQGSHYRKNLEIECLEIDSLTSKQELLQQILPKIQTPAIVFVPYQKTAQNISQYVNELGYTSNFFHAGVEVGHKTHVQNTFMQGECDIIVATIAFGMGVDKENIRTIIHLSIPQSIENYVQEIGRAGRDGNPSKCICCVSEQDVWEMLRLISLSKPELEDIKTLVSYFSQRLGYHFLSTRKLSMDLAIDEIALNLILKQLESEKVLKMYSNVKSEFKCEKHYDISQLETVKKSIIEKTPQQLHNEMNILLSQPFFKTMRKKWLDIDEVLQNSNTISYFKLLSSIDLLIELEIIHCIDIQRAHLFLVRFEIDELDVDKVYSYFESNFKHNYNQIIQISELLRSKQCIQREILSYFGEELVECGMCHNCIKNNINTNTNTKKNKTTQLITDSLTLDSNSSLVEFKQMQNIAQRISFTNTESVEITILKALIIDPFLSQKDLPLILRGELKKSHAKWKFKTQSYKKLEYIAKEQLDNTITKLLQKQCLEVDINGFLRVTKRGVDAVTSNE